VRRQRVNRPRHRARLGEINRDVDRSGVRNAAGETAVGAKGRVLVKERF